MLVLKKNKLYFIDKQKKLFYRLLITINSNISLINIKNVRYQVFLVGPSSLGILIITAYFIGIIFTLQIIKEFLYLNASSCIGAILSLSFIRELSPVLTAVILTGKISSAFTAELATMQVTEQIDALYILRVSPLHYLILPRLIACLLMLPCLNIIFLLTSLSSSILICSIFYSIHPLVFIHSACVGLSYIDLLKSTTKALAFSLVIAIISCIWGLITKGGAKKVGQATTSSVVTSLLLIFIVDCILTYFLFNQSVSIIRSL